MIQACRSRSSPAMTSSPTSTKINPRNRRKALCGSASQPTRRSTRCPAKAMTSKVAHKPTTYAANKANPQPNRVGRTVTIT